MNKTLELIFFLISQKGMSQNQFLAEVGLTKNTFQNWKARDTVPKGEALSIIANGLGVTVDYLLGRDTPSGLSLSPEEEELVRCYRQLNNDGKKKMTDYLDDLLGNEKNLSVPTASAESAG